MKCNSCGQEIKDGAKFCENCGAKVSDSTGEEAKDELYEKYTAEYEKEKARIKKSKIRWMRFAWIGSLVFAVIAVVFKYFKNDSVMDPVIVFLCVTAAICLFLIGITNRFFTSKGDRARLNQINQAYENAKMMK